VLPGVYAPRAVTETVLHQVVGAYLERFLAAIARRIERLVVRRGLTVDADATDPFAAESLALAGLASAPVQGRLALGRGPGRASSASAPIPTRRGSSRRSRCRRGAMAATCTRASRWRASWRPMARAARRQLSTASRNGSIGRTAMRRRRPPRPSLGRSSQRPRRRRTRHRRVRRLHQRPDLWRLSHQQQTCRRSRRQTI
jgi:hypothetical protein